LRQLSGKSERLPFSYNLTARRVENAAASDIQDGKKEWNNGTFQKS
jgi:hypothetical protein